MTRRSTRSIARLALIVLVGVVAVLGGRQVISNNADGHSSSPTAVLANAANHAPATVADRPASRTGLFAIGVLLLSLAGLAIGAIGGWTVESTDRRTLATTLGLQHRRRGPPHAHTV